jgi:hypothetical protein
MRKYYKHVGHDELLRAVVILWNVTPCSLVEFTDVSEEIMPPPSGSKNKPNNQRKQVSRHEQYGTQLRNTE